MLRTAPLSLCLLLLAPLGAQAPKPDTAAAAKGTFALEAGETKASELIDRAAAFLGWNVLVGQQECPTMGQLVFKLQRRTEVDAAGCEDLLSTLLATQGYVVMPLDESKSLYEVLNLNGPRGREVWARAPHRTPEQVLARPSLRMPVLTTVQLEHINATIATNALRPFFASSGQPGNNTLTIGNVGNNAAMLLCGMQDQVAHCVRLLKVCDVPAPKEPAPGLLEQLQALQQRVQALESRGAEPPAEGRRK